MKRIVCSVITLWVSMAVIAQAQAPPPLWVRAQNFVVTPSTGPVTHVLVKNRLDTKYTGTLKVEFPQGWKVNPTQHALALAPGETRSLAFTIEKGFDREANSYPLTIVAEGVGGTIEIKQTVVCASAPYGKPVVDGDLAEWKDALPISFATGGRKTVLRAFWNNRHFSLAVEAEEEELNGLDEALPGRGMDAIQFSLAPSSEGADPSRETQPARHEFLVAAIGSRGDGGARCYRLYGPSNDAGVIARKRPRAGLEMTEALAAVKRSGKTTVYEVAIPFRQMPEIRPTPGREVRFSLLVHDPDGSGLRDLGQVMNRWEEHRTPLGWCSWEGVKWGSKVPFDGDVEFGFCSSIH